MRQLFDLLTGWIVQRRWLTGSGVLLISGLAIVGYRDAEFFRRLISRTQATAATDDVQSAQAANVPDIEPIRLTHADAIIVVESDAFFTPQGAAAMRAVIERLEALDYVTHVLWMDRVPMLNIFGLPEPLFPRSHASPQRFAAARERALRHPLVKGQLLSPDGRTLLLMVRFDWLFVRSDEDCIERLKQTAQAAAAEFPDVAFAFSVTGEAPWRLTAIKEHETNEVKYQVVGYGMIALMSIILFRGLAAVVVVALAPALGVFWTLGILRFFDLQDNPFNDVVLPVLISLVGLTDGVHLMVQIRRLRAAGLPGRDAALAGVQEVGMSCFLTSLTTAIGFGSLGLAHHEIVREFGWSCVIGVGLTFIAVLTVIPLACSTWLGGRVQIGHESGLIDRHLARLSGLIDFVLRYPRQVSIAAIVSTLVLTVIPLVVLRPDERNANSLPDESEPLVALQKMDRALGGLELGRVEINWSGRAAPDDREVLSVISQIDDLLCREELIGHPLSLRNLLDALPGEGDAADRMSMLALLPPPLKRAYYTPETHWAKIEFRVQDLGIATYGPVFERIEAGLQRIMQRHPQFTLDLAGAAVWRWRNLYQIVVDLATSLGSAAVIIFFTLTLAYRSLRLGIIAIIPNVFPLALTGTCLAVMGLSLELVSVCAFTICLGIAVDDSIHFLTRFQKEQLRTDDSREAIRNAFTRVGAGLVMTTVVLLAGFSTVIFSGLRDHRIFASMGSLTIAAALFGDLIFLPALLDRFAKPSPVTPPASQLEASVS
jgi:predicted RND superfamily exporter protein